MVEDVFYMSKEMERWEQSWIELGQRGGGQRERRARCILVLTAATLQRSTQCKADGITASNKELETQNLMP